MKQGFLILKAINKNIAIEILKKISFFSLSWRVILRPPKRGKEEFLIILKNCFITFFLNFFLEYSCKFVILINKIFIKKGKFFTMKQFQHSASINSADLAIWTLVTSVKQEKRYDKAWWIMLPLVLLWSGT